MSRQVPSKFGVWSSGRLINRQCAKAGDLDERSRDVHGWRRHGEVQTRSAGRCTPAASVPPALRPPRLTFISINFESETFPNSGVSPRKRWGAYGQISPLVLARHFQPCCRSWDKPRSCCLEPSGISSSDADGLMSVQRPGVGITSPLRRLSSSHGPQIQVRPPPISSRWSPPD